MATVYQPASDIARKVNLQPGIALAVTSPCQIPDSLQEL